MNKGDTQFSAQFICLVDHTTICLQPARVADVIAEEASALRFPSGACRVPGSACVKAKTANFHEDVAFAHIDCHIVTVAFFAVVKELL